MIYNFFAFAFDLLRISCQRFSAFSNLTFLQVIYRYICLFNDKVSEIIQFCHSFSKTSTLKLTVSKNMISFLSSVGRAIPNGMPSGQCNICVNLFIFFLCSHTFIMIGQNFNAQPTICRCKFRLCKHELQFNNT